MTWCSDKLWIVWVNECVKHSPSVVLRMQESDWLGFNFSFVLMMDWSLAFWGLASLVGSTEKPLVVSQPWELQCVSSTFLVKRTWVQLTRTLMTLLNLVPSVRDITWSPWQLCRSFLHHSNFPLPYWLPNASHSCLTSVFLGQWAGCFVCLDKVF